MAIPDYQSFHSLVLNVLMDGKEHSRSEIREAVETVLPLTEEDREQRLASGETLFASRSGWSVTFLVKANAIERVRRGVFRITQRGRDLVRRYPEGVRDKELREFPEFEAFLRGGGKVDPKPAVSEDTPQERLDRAHRELQDTLAAELLSTVRQVTPAFFEQLVVDVMVKMGYGGSVKDAGRALGKSGDGGVDGVIKEDPLGLDRIYLQAKRWADTVGRPVVQAFAGSLEGHRARKGVLITTSQFSGEAKDYVERIEKRIVLIDGEELARLMVEHGVGVATAQTYLVKKIDLDYFEGD